MLRGPIKAALLVSADGEREFIYVIEDHGEDHLTVLLPWAPTAFAGIVKIVDRKRVELLDANLGDVSKVLSQWGVGANGLLGKAAAGGNRPTGSSQ